MASRGAQDATQLAAAIWRMARGGLAGEKDPRIGELVALRNLQPTADKREVYKIDIAAGEDQHGRAMILELKHLRGTGWIARAAGQALHSFPRPVQSEPDAEDDAPKHEANEPDPLEELQRQIERLDNLQF